jgi:hypothetical protein
MAETPPTDELRKFKESHPDLYGKGLPLWETDAGVNELAWKRADALDVIAALQLDGQCILGGDAWEVAEGNRPSPLYDNWHYKPSGQGRDSSSSKELADRWIESYRRREDSVRFVLVWRPA